MRWGAPVTGFLIGSTSVSSTPLATRRATRPFLSNENSNGTNSGSWIVVTIRLKIWNRVPSPEFFPDMMLKTPCRCSGVARSSMIGCIFPLPSCSAPGKSTVAAKTRPSSLVPSKCPLVILMLTIPLQDPWVGGALKSQGHPKAVVAPHQAVAERSLEGISNRTAAHRVQAGRAGLTDPFASGRKSPFMKAGCGKTARPVCAADGGQRKSNRTRLLRPDTPPIALSVGRCSRLIIPFGVKNVWVNVSRIGIRSEGPALPKGATRRVLQLAVLIREAYQPTSPAYRRGHKKTLANYLPRCPVAPAWLPPRPLRSRLCYTGASRAQVRFLQASQRYPPHQLCRQRPRACIGRDLPRRIRRGLAGPHRKHIGSGCR